MTRQLVLPSATGAPSRIGQGTVVEQSRAVAQVQAAAVMARQFPRASHLAIAQMEDACRRTALAQNAFYEYRRGGKVVTGPTIKLAQELARIWGNVDYGMTELRRDGDGSEMLAYAWDLETNARFAQIVIVLHRRDKTVDGEKVSEALTDQRDVYEANTSSAARRLREAIFRVLPGWFVDQAETLCRQTLENPPDDDRTLDQRVAALADAFEERWSVSRDRLEERVGKPMSAWTAFDVGQMQVTWKTLSRGESTADEAFPQRRVSINSLPVAPPAPPPPAPVPAAVVEDQAPAVSPAPEPETVSDPKADDDHAPARPSQIKHVHTKLRSLGIIGNAVETDLATLLRRPVASPHHIREVEVEQLLVDLQRCLDDQEPVKAYDALLAARAEQAGDDQ